VQPRNLLPRPGEDADWLCQSADEGSGSLFHTSSEAASCRSPRFVRQATRQRSRDPLGPSRSKNRPPKRRERGACENTSRRFVVALRKRPARRLRHPTRPHLPSDASCKTSDIAVQHPAGGSRLRGTLPGIAGTFSTGRTPAAPPTLPEITPVAIRSLHRAAVRWSVSEVFGAGITSFLSPLFGLSIVVMPDRVRRSRSARSGIQRKKPARHAPSIFCRAA
jgi:hypothetical protein